MKKKILFVAPNLKAGGAEKVLTKIINNFNLEEYIVKLVLLKKEGSLLSSLNKEIEVTDLNIERSISSPIKLYKIIKKEKPDLIFSIIGQINLILAFLKVMHFKKTAFIGRENVVYSEWLYKEKSIKKIILNYAYKLLLKKLDVVIVQSEFMKKQVVEYFKVSDKKIRVLKNPLEHEKIRKLEDEPITDPFWDNRKINLLAVGRIEKVKNYEEMIDIFSILPENFHLNILGEGHEKTNVQLYIDKMGMNDKVSLYGFIENPYKFMKKSFGILLTSTRESLPNVILEANACGTYAFTYNSPGGIPEIVCSNNSNGIIVEFGNKREMAEAIVQTYKKGYNKDRIIQLTKKYSVEEYLERLYEIFNAYI